MSEDQPVSRRRRLVRPLTGGSWDQVPSGKGSSTRCALVFKAWSGPKEWRISGAKRRRAIVRQTSRAIGKEDRHEQNEPRRSLRNALGRPRAHGQVLPRGVRLADADAWRRDGQLCPRHDDRNGREPPEGARRDQWRLLPEKARLAGATSVRRHWGR